MVRRIVTNSDYKIFKWLIIVTKQNYDSIHRILVSRSCEKDKNVCMDSKNHVQRKIMFVFIN